MCVCVCVCVCVSGGIEDYVKQILLHCGEQEVATVFAMSRYALAKILKKKRKIGCVGIFYFDGAEVHNSWSRVWFHCIWGGPIVRYMVLV